MGAVEDAIMFRMQQTQRETDAALGMIDQATGANRDPRYADVGELSALGMSNAYLDQNYTGPNITSDPRTMAGQVFSTDEAQMLGVLRSAAEREGVTLEEQTDANGRQMVRVPGRNDWMYLNEPGLSGRDALMLTRDAAAFGGGGYGALQGASRVGGPVVTRLLSRLGLGAAAGGGTSVGMDLAADAAGSDQGVDWGRAATSAAFEGLGAGMVSGRRGPIAYHGTRGPEFDRFSPDAIGSGMDGGRGIGGNLGSGHYLTSEESIARDMYAGADAFDYGIDGYQGGSVMPFHVDMQNPLRLDLQPLGDYSPGRGRPGGMKGTVTEALGIDRRAPQPQPQSVQDLLENQARRSELRAMGRSRTPAQNSELREIQNLIDEDIRPQPSVSDRISQELRGRGHGGIIMDLDTVPQNTRRRESRGLEYMLLNPDDAVRVGAPMQPRERTRSALAGGGSAISGRTAEQEYRDWYNETFGNGR